MEKKLPKNWVECSIGEIVSSKRGRKPSSTIDYQKDGYIPYILIDEMEGKPIRSYTNDPKVSIVNEKDVLIVWDGSIGKCGSGINGAIGSTLVALTPMAEIPTKFVEYLLIDKNSFIKQTSTGTGLQHINKDFFEICRLNLPPLAEQNRIVAKLDALFAQLETIKTSMAKVPLLLKDFRQQVLTQAVTGKLTEEWRKGKNLQKWKTISLDQTLISLDQGWSPQCESFPSISENKWGVIKTSSIQKMKFLDYENKQLPKHLDAVKKYEIEPNDVLITRAGPRIRVGICCHVKITRKKLMICDKVYRLKVNLKLALPNLIEIVLNSEDKLKEIEKMKTGISDSGLNLTQAKIKAIEFLLPPLEEQQEIVSRVESLFAKADAIEKQYETLKAKIDTLPQAILHKAFKGELTEQLDSDGDARELLREIEGLKEQTAKVSKKKKVKV